MRARRHGVETWVRLLAAGAGTVLAHTIDYAAVFPDRATRGRVLAATGHGYWHLAVLAAMAAGLAGAALAVARGATSALDQEGTEYDPQARWHRVGAADIVVVQVGVFAGLELLERVSAGLSPRVLLHERAFVLGIAVQLLVGAVIAVVLAGLHRAGRYARTVLGRAARRPSRPARSHWPSIAVGSAPSAPRWRPRQERAPPVSA